MKALIKRRRSVALFINTELLSSTDFSEGDWTNYKKKGRGKREEKKKEQEKKANVKETNEQTVFEAADS